MTDADAGAERLAAKITQDGAGFWVSRLGPERAGPFLEKQVEARAAAIAADPYWRELHATIDQQAARIERLEACIEILHDRAYECTCLPHVPDLLCNRCLAAAALDTTKQPT